MASATTSLGSSSFHSTHSNNYDKMASNSTFSIAKLALSDPIFASFPITSSSYVLDNACGTGIVTSLIKIEHPNVRVLGADLAPGMIDTFKAKAQKEEWKNVETKVIDSKKLEGVEDAVFSHVITNFGFTPGTEDKSGPYQVAKEIWRVTGERGVVVVTTWAERNFTDALEAAALRIRPRETPFSWDLPEEWGRGSWLMKQLEDAGFGNRVTVKRVEGRMEARSLDELVGNLMGAKDMFYKGYSDEEVERLPEVLKEEVKKLESYDEREDSVGIKMVAWVGFAWK
ncbi:S-adenosyl-L-methionine-dependent methyltransferase [Hyaloscypha variabilis F]|uniref:S-adenosyl-L-methionine-dependent methyltransferase n=1 Tax=Hyaloscypha variabilis (strain UAMH 11265 / GT02V1 / F) TaxID=1149755 RepID=A0A2J6S6H6_HYAVF|nr:S-adenosyl-L-methionine-dependent methyltransferase [Hyaloscypha variabilis F]